MRICAKRGDGVSIEGEQIEEVNELTYLSSIVSAKGGTDEDIQPRIGTTKTKLSVFGSNVQVSAPV